MRLAGKTAIITGAANGIGQAMALAFAAEGALVGIADIDLGGAEALSRRIRASGGSEQALAIDVRDEEQVDAGVDRFAAAHGRLDVMIANAGVQHLDAIANVSFADWKRLMAVHLDGSFLCARAALRWWLAYGLSVGVGQFALLFLAIRHGMPAGVASVTPQSQAFFTLGFSALLLRERRRWRQVAALAVAGCGLYLLASGAGGYHGADWLSFMLTLGAAAFWGLSNVVLRMAADSRRQSDAPFDLMGFIVWTSLIPPLPFALLSLWLDGSQQVLDSLLRFSLPSFAAVAYLAFVGTLLGSGLFSALLTRHAPGRVAPYTLLVPVFGLGTAALVLGKRLSPLQLQGCALVLAGLVINTCALPLLRAAKRVLRFAAGAARWS